MQKIYIFSKITFHKKPNFSHWKVNFSDYLFSRNLTPYSPPPRTLMKDLSSPFLHPSKPVKKIKTKQQPKPLLRAVASASMCENIGRSYLLPCCSFNFILAGLDHFIFRHCKHLWLKAKGEFWYCPQNFLHFTVSWSPFTTPELLPCFSLLYF